MEFDEQWLKYHAPLATGLLFPGRVNGFLIFHLGSDGDKSLLIVLMMFIII
jgi:hypothetical protein